MILKQAPDTGRLWANSFYPQSVKVMNFVFRILVCSLFFNFSTFALSNELEINYNQYFEKKDFSNALCVIKMLTSTSPENLIYRRELAKMLAANGKKQEFLTEIRMIRNSNSPQSLQIIWETIDHPLVSQELKDLAKILFKSLGDEPVLSGWPPDLVQNLKSSGKVIIAENETLQSPRSSAQVAVSNFSKGEKNTQGSGVLAKPNSVPQQGSCASAPTNSKYPPAGDTQNKPLGKWLLSIAGVLLLVSFVSFYLHSKDVLIIFKDYTDAVISNFCFLPLSTILVMNAFGFSSISFNDAFYYMSPVLFLALLFSLVSNKNIVFALFSIVTKAVLPFSFVFIFVAYLLLSGNVERRKGEYSWEFENRKQQHLAKVNALLFAILGAFLTMVSCGVKHREWSSIGNLFSKSGSNPTVLNR